MEKSVHPHVFQVPTIVLLHVAGNRKFELDVPVNSFF